MTRPVLELPLRQANPEPSLSDCGPCNLGTVLAYVSTSHADKATAPGLTLAIQAHACQMYARCRLGRCVKATFADRGRSVQKGFRQLLAHLEVCRNHLIIVQRLDRLPLSGFQTLASLGTRIVSATGERLPRRQAEFLADVARLARMRR